MAHYNFSNFIIKNFDLSFVNDNGIGMLQTKEFANFDEAYQYMKLLYSDKDMARKLSGMRAIVISASNFELLQSISVLMIMRNSITNTSLTFLNRK